MVIVARLAGAQLLCTAEHLTPVQSKAAAVLHQHCRCVCSSATKLCQLWNPPPPDRYMAEVRLCCGQWVRPPSGNGALRSGSRMAATNQRNQKNENGQGRICHRIRARLPSPLTSGKITLRIADQRVCRLCRRDESDAFDAQYVALSAVLVPGRRARCPSATQVRLPPCA